MGVAPVSVSLAQIVDSSETPATAPAAAFGAGLDLPGAVPPPAPPAVRLGGFFGFPFARPADPLGGDTFQGWNVTPSLTLRVRGTDNRFATPRDKQADLITDVTPAVLVTADTAWLQGRIYYAPTFQYFASTPGEARIDQRFNGGATATLVPGSLFLDLRGFARTQSITGGYAPEGDSTVARGNRAQTYSFQATPYYVHRFGGTASALAGYAFQYASQQGNAVSASPGALPFYRPQEFNSHTGFAALRSGEDFGRLALEARVSGTTYIGDGIFDGARRNIGTVETRYAIVRGLSVLAEGGYEDQRYAGRLPFRVNEPVWSLGFRLDPGPESVIIARYGHRDGYNSAFLSASVALGGRTRLLASYTDRLSVSVQRAADLLTTTEVDEYGNAIDIATGAPALPAFGTSFLTLQSGLFRIKRARVSLVQSWPQDTVTLTLSHEDRSPVAVARDTQPFSQRGTYGTVSWARALALRTTTIGTLQYGRSESGTLGIESDLFTASGSLIYEFSPTLFGSLQYILTNRQTDLPTSGSGLANSGTALQNVVLATLRQFF